MNDKQIERAIDEAAHINGKQRADMALRLDAAKVELLRRQTAPQRPVLGDSGGLTEEQVLLGRHNAINRLMEVLDCEEKQADFIVTVALGAFNFGNSGALDVDRYAETREVIVEALQGFMVKVENLGFVTVDDHGCDTVRGNLSEESVDHMASRLMLELL